MNDQELFERTRNLYAPNNYGSQPCRYHDATRAMIAEHTGGCGPGGTGDFLVPDTIWGLNIKPSCSIHDWMYAFGEKRGDKDLADVIFLENMLRQIEEGSSWLKFLRRHRAVDYYGAVKDLGDKAFWKGKAKP